MFTVIDERMIKLLNNVFLIATILLLQTISEGFGQSLCLADFSKVEDGRVCRKVCLENSDCVSPSKSCNCDGVCGMSCFNPLAECPEPPGITNGKMIKRAGFKYGDVVRYSCDDNYELQGSSERKCRSDKKWTGTEAVCIRGCGEPTRIKSAYATTLKRGFQVETKINYKCLFGFEMSGDDSTSECLSDFQWSVPTFTCEKLDCGEPEGILHGQFDASQGFLFAAEVTYECDAGFELSGFKTRQCLTSKRWSNAPPICSPVECDPPPSVKNGILLDSVKKYEYRDIVRYRCKEGYVFNAGSEATCNADKQWENLPECSIDLSCTFDDHTRRICDYTITGNIEWQRTTVDGANLLPTAAMFVSMPYDSSAILRSGIIPSKDPHCLQFEYKIAAKPPHERFPVMLINLIGGGRAAMIHQKDHAFKWLQAQTTLESTNQKTIQFNFEVTARNTQIYVDNIRILEGVCNSNCPINACSNRGHCADRITSRSCFCTDGYKGSNCELDVECPPRYAPTNGRMDSTNSGSFKYKTSLQFSCNSGYRLDGEGSSTCQLNEEWSTSAPTCQEIICPWRDNPADGFVIRNPPSSRSIKTTLTYTCKDGYDLIGTSFQTCGSTGRWSANAPKCSIKKCPERFKPAHGTITGNQMFGSWIIYSCDTGFELKGKSFAFCQSDGTWSVVEEPTCEGIIVECVDTVPHPSNGWKPNRKNQYFTGDEMSFRCNTGYKLSHNNNVKCKINGEWEGSVPTCDDEGTASCKMQEFLTGATEPIKETYHPLETVTFSCWTGILVGHSSVECNRDGTWTGPPPQCRNKKNNRGVPCPEDYYLWDGVCQGCTAGSARIYKAALAKCAEDGANPVAIRSREAKTKMFNFMKNKFNSIRYGKLHFFTGLSNINKQEYSWESGEKHPNTNFFSLSPVAYDSVVTVKLAHVWTGIRWEWKSYSYEITRANIRRDVHCQRMPFNYTGFIISSKANVKFNGVFEVDNGVIYNDNLVYKHTTYETDLHLYFDLNSWRIGLFDIVTGTPGEYYFSLLAVDMTETFISWQYGTLMPALGGLDADVKIRKREFSTKKWNSWLEWSDCVAGQRTRQRSCKDYGMEGKHGCQGEKTHAKSCQVKPIWSKFSPCSATCGDGKKVRMCTDGPCSGQEDKQNCNEGDCPSWRDWSECSLTCGGGEKTRKCSISGGCQGLSRQPCNVFECHDAVTEDIDKWTECSTTCGEGVETCYSDSCQVKTRSCNLANCGEKPTAPTESTVSTVPTVSTSDKCTTPSIDGVSYEYFGLPLISGSEIEDGSKITFICKPPGNRLVGVTEMTCNKALWSVPKKDYPTCV